jgi:predicted DNA-binding transcriptional regulator AlpA
MKFLNEKEVAQMLSISVAALRRWRLINRGPQWVKFGSAVRYPEDALCEWVNNQPGGSGKETA